MIGGTNLTLNCLTDYPVVMMIFVKSCWDYTPCFCLIVVLVKIIFASNLSLLFSSPFSQKGEFICKATLTVLVSDWLLLMGFLLLKLEITLHILFSIQTM